MVLSEIPMDQAYPKFNWNAVDNADDGLRLKNGLEGMTPTSLKIFLMCYLVNWRTCTIDNSLTCINFYV